MNPKAGLHKKVAFIFDGSPASDTLTNTATEPEPAAAEIPVAAQPRPFTQFSAQTTPSENNIPAEPMQRTSASAGTPKKIHKTIKKKGKSNAAQNKKLTLVGVLAVVFVGVLYFVLFGGQQKPPKKAAAASAADTQFSAQPDLPKTAWTQPQPWPENTRDPLKFGPANTGESDEGSSACQIKGIVYSQTHPSAILGTRIVSEGDTVDGMTIIKIHKDAVEFEKDGKKWTQKVQP